VRVLLVDLETEWRGGQNQALLLLKGLSRRGHETELVSADRSALGERAAASGTTVHYVSRGFFRLFASRKIRERLRVGRFDLVHANEAHAVTAAWLARVHCRVPFIISRRVGYPLGRSWLAQSRYRAASKILAISHWAANQAAQSGAPPERLDVVHEGVELPAATSPELRRAARARWGIPEDAPLLGCVGVLSADKGQEWLIRALTLVRREFPSCRLLLAGDGPCRSRLEALSKELRVPHSVTFAGFAKDVESVYAALDIFVLPSFFEALSNALMSAMSYGLPSIAFELGGPAEIIEHGKSGLLVQPADAESLRSAIVSILADTRVAESLRAGARERIAQKFSADTMVEKTLRVYAEALRTSRR
jgi:glycosyltransferase involved in cell wall biosynthesis